jgi:hypothetical protein
MSNQGLPDESTFVPLEERLTDPDFPEILGQLGGATRSVQRPEKLGLAKPSWVYMIYLYFNPDGKLVVGQLEQAFGPGGLDGAERSLLQRARNDDFDEINFRSIRWQRPYYLTFVIDNEAWKFHWGRDGDNDPLRFMFRKPDSSDTYETNNYTFFDSVKRPNLGRGDAFRVVNYHLNQQGNPLATGQVVKYSFEIALETPFRRAFNPQTHIVLIIDPDGQNQGPRI